jgi:hypothetical protein
LIRSREGGTVPRLTKSEIEGALLAGSAVQWVDSAGKSAIVQLATARQRRLFQYLLRSQFRDVKALPQAFVDGLATAYVAVGDPAAPNVQQTVNPSASGPWKIQALKIEGFGGVNIWNQSPFELAVDCESLLMEGPNGSGNPLWSQRSFGLSRESVLAIKEVARSKRRSLFLIHRENLLAHGLR